ncbi:MAG: hypothetical protein Q7K34_02530 [archaeon]|nr:hypothetical protein [archaeon]
MEKSDALLESVKKLVSMGVSDKEILDSLVGMGSTKSEAQDLLRLAKNAPAEEKQKMENDILSSQGFEENPGPKKSLVPSFDLSGGKQEGDLSGRENKMLELWEKGILATVDSKLSEMEKIKREIDRSLEKKAGSAFEKESKKLSTVFESQRVLALEKANTALDQKKKEFESLVDAKIAEMKKLNSLSEEYLKKLDSQSKFNQALIEEIDSKVSGLEDMKSRFLKDFNLVLADSSSKVGGFIKQSEDKRNELNQRINRSLNLETKIVEGLLTDAQNKIDNLAITKAAELEGVINSKISAKSQLLEAIFDQEQKKMNRFFLDTKKEAEEVVKKIEQKEKQIDVERIKATMEELDAFRKQFVSNIKKMSDSFEKAKKELSDLIETREELIGKKVKLIDAKMEELSAFEKGFAEEMGIAIETLVAKKNSPPAVPAKPEKKSKKA